jgi:hypothetical protein
MPRVKRSRNIETAGEMPSLSSAEQTGRNFRRPSLLGRLFLSAGLGAGAPVAVGYVGAELQARGILATIPGESRAYAVECDGPFTVLPDGTLIVIPGNCGVPPADNGGSGSGGGSSGGSGGNQPPATTTTTIPWERRNDDGDSVSNGGDNCPGTAPGEIVNTVGCSASQRDDDSDLLLGGAELFIGTDPNNSDTDKDGLSDGAEVLEQDGSIKVQLDADADMIIDALESNQDNDGDTLSPATGDPNDADPCLPSLISPTCDKDDDGIFGAEDLNPTVPYEDIDGDRLDDTALPENGGDPDLTDGPKADSDKDGVINSKDREPGTALGAEVDESGVAIVLDNSLPSTTATTIVATGEPETTVEAVTGGADDEGSGDSSDMGYLLIGGAALASVTLIGSGLVIGHRRRLALGAKVRLQS